MKEKINSSNIINILKKISPIMLLCVYFIVIHINISPISGDDVFFGNVSGNLFSFIIGRYNNWSSRIFIETILISILTYVPFLWKIIDVLIIILIYYSLNKLFNKKNSIYIKIIIVILMIIYPFMQMNSAGWGATTVNYLWPLALGLFSVIPIIKEANNEKYDKKILFLSIPSFVFTINQEQICALYFGFLLLFNIYYYLVNKKINKLLIMYLIFNILSLIFILTCPGNGVRFNSEMITWFKQYKHLNLFQKLCLSLNNTFYLLLGKTNYLFISLYLLVIYFLIKNKKNRLLIGFAFLLFVGVIVIPYLNIYRSNNLYIIHYLTSNNILECIQMNSKSFICSIVLAVIYIISTCYILYQIFSSNHNKYIKYFVPIIFIAGFLSEMIIGFSPTIYVSAYRAAIFMYFSFIIIFIYIINELKLKKKDYLKIITSLIIILLFAKIIIFAIDFRL